MWSKGTSELLESFSNPEDLRDRSSILEHELKDLLPNFDTDDVQVLVDCIAIQTVYIDELRKLIK